MQTALQVEQEFKKELNAFLLKWGATIEADDHWQGYNESS